MDLPVFGQCVRSISLRAISPRLTRHPAARSRPQDLFVFLAIYIFFRNTLRRSSENQVFPDTGLDMLDTPGKTRQNLSEKLCRIMEAYRKGIEGFSGHASWLHAGIE